MNDIFAQGNSIGLQIRRVNHLLTLTQNDSQMSCAAVVETGFAQRSHTKQTARPTVPDERTQYRGHEHEPQTQYQGHEYGPHTQYRGHEHEPQTQYQGHEHAPHIQYRGQGKFSNWSPFTNAKGYGTGFHGLKNSYATDFSSANHTNSYGGAVKKAFMSPFVTLPPPEDTIPYTFDHHMHYDLTDFGHDSLAHARTLDPGHAYDFGYEQLDEIASQQIDPQAPFYQTYDDLPYY